MSRDQKCSCLVVTAKYKLLAVE